MYFYSTGSSITDLEMNGHEIQKSESVHKENSYVHKVIQLHPYYNEENDDQHLDAEADVKNWPEEKRIATLKKSICQFIGYDPKKSPLSKQRHWIAIYRIAADKGFIIEGDFAYFKRIIDDMQIYNPQIQISAESETKRSIFREKDKTKRSKKESAQHSKSRNKSFVMTSVSAL